MIPAKVLPCELCNRPTRPARAKIADFPGTVYRYAGKCMACYQRAPDQPGRPTTEQNRAALEAWLRGRGRGAA